MFAIAVDDEVLMLGALVAAVKASPDISEVAQFTGCDDALDFVRDNVFFPSEVIFTIVSSSFVKEPTKLDCIKSVNIS